MRVAQVIINRPAKQLHKPLSYLMPEKFGNVLPGTRVLIRSEERRVGKEC